MIWLLIAGIGIVLNLVVFGFAIRDEPNGAQGAEIAFLFALIPYVFVVGFILATIHDRWL